jgi:hypothetical protein
MTHKMDIARVSELFDRVEEETKFQPVHVLKDGTEVAVVLSPQRYLELLMKGVDPKVRPEVVELSDMTIKKHGPVYEFLAKYERGER